MARFNTAKVQPVSKTVNLAGGEAYTVNEKFELVSILLTSFVSDQYYRSANDTIERVKQLLPKVGYEFAAKTALYARNTFGMRSITHIVAGEIAANVRGVTWTTPFFLKVFDRPDDMLEVVSYYAQAYGKKGQPHPLPNALKRAIRTRLMMLNEYQMAKYKAGSKTIKMVDLINLTSPKPTPAITALVKGTLAPADTWETNLTAAGQKAQSEEELAVLKAEAWKDLLENNKLGYMALIRNCRNIIQQAPKLIPMLATALTNEDHVKKSRLFPFQFMTARKQITERKIVAAISDAMEISLQNVPRFEGKTLVAIDASGSMSWGGVGGSKSTTTPVEIAALFGAALYKSNDADVIVFHGSSRFVDLNPRDSLDTITQKLSKTPGGATDFKSVFKLIMKENKAYDRIIFLSDMQGWVGYDSPREIYNNYSKQIGNRPFLYMFDLQGYGSTQFPEANVFLMTGFSDKVFDTMEKLETDKNALVNVIEMIKLV